MPSTESSSSGIDAGRVAAAEEVYIAHLEASGGVADVVGLARAHPDLAPALARIHEEYAWLDELCGSASGSLSESSTSDASGSRLSVEDLVQTTDSERYQVRGEVGRGGMGTVLRVWDDRLRRELAMKVSVARPEGGSARAPASRSIYRFLEEAQVMSQLDHPGVLPVHDVGIDSEGHVFFTMPLVRGESLKQAFRHLGDPDGRWTRSRLVGILVRICETMAFAHGKGVIHRDLKPSNIMVGRLGEVYVMDWGLARVLGRPDPHAETGEALATESGRESIVGLRRSRAELEGELNLLTMDGSVIGTPSFMSPEQARGETDRVGETSDVYAVGAILYQLLSGRAPYADPNDSIDAKLILEKVRASGPTPISDLEPSSAPELVAVCEKAMARRLEDRYSGIEQLGEDLRAWLENRVVGAHRTGPWVEARKWVQRNLAVAVTSGLLVVALFAGVVAVAYLQTTKGARIAFERDRADYKAYAASIAAAQASIETGRVDVAREHLAASPPELRGWEWHYLEHKLDASLLVVETGMGAHVDIAFTPDGTRIVAADEAGHVAIFEASTGSELARAQGTLSGSGPVHLALHPAGDRILVANELHGWAIWDLEELVELLARPDTSGSKGSICFSPDGSRFAVPSEGGFTILDSTAVEPVVVQDGLDTGVHALAFADGGQELRLLSSDGRLFRFDASSGEPLEEPETVTREYSFHHRPLAVEDEWTLVGRSDGSALVTDDTLPERPRVLTGHASRVWRIAAHGTLDLVALGSWDHTASVWSPETGERYSWTRGHTDRISGLAWHPRDPVLATASQDGTIRVWDALSPSTGDEVVLPERLELGTVLPDGDLLLAGPHPGWSRWSAETGDAELRVSQYGDAIHVVEVDPTSGLVVAGCKSPWVELYTVDGLFRRRLPHHGPVYDVELHPSEPLLFAGGPHRLAVWDTDSWELVAEETVETVVYQTLARPSDGALLTCGTSGLLRERDPRTLRVLRSVEIGPGRTRAALSPDGTLLATGGDDRVVRVWDADSLDLLHEFSGHADSVRTVTFTPDGKQVASGGRDQTVRLWSLGRRLPGAHDSRLPLLDQRALLPPGRSLAGRADREDPLPRRSRGSQARRTSAEARGRRSTPGGRAVRRAPGEGGGDPGALERRPVGRRASARPVT